ncbi:UPF0575 protein C19orf67 homolog [Pyxicephalus adspersus]|uniref:Uncharacterized protein n=1 Tax=Pyxicephalus adspersus TaxID=30357 RepID=A0AAV3ATN7_PYXAD|nr:TPA: hypothetical protein GDO54_006115 [Pyxicephalus adspersus]DBA30088.1 TPA: hypothetical protein GDO54_006115 [Pyxicephalus adspersus]
MASDEPSISTQDGQAEDVSLDYLNRNLMYLLHKIEVLKVYLPLANNFVPDKHFSTELLILMKNCEPLLLYLESAARSITNNRSPVCEILKRQLLDMSELLVKHLEHLSLLYNSFGLISLNDMDPEGMPAVLCGRFSL